MSPTLAASTAAIMSNGRLTDWSLRTPGKRYKAAVTATACFGSTVSMTKAWISAASRASDSFTA